MKALPKQPIQIDQIGFFTAVVPKPGEGRILSNSDERFKSGGQVTCFPATTIGLLLVTFKSGKQNRGTASLVGPNQAITAAHILYNQGVKGHDNEIVKIEFFISLCLKEIQFGHMTVLKAMVLGEYKEGKSSADSPNPNDLALLILDSPIGL